MSVTSPHGFVAAGVACGIKASGALDLALVATAGGRPVPAAAVFTRNRVSAAPVDVSRAHISATDGRAAAVVLNSGNANAATGAGGVEAAERMCAVTADVIGCSSSEVLVCSTGLIGIPLPIDVVEAGIPKAAAALAADGGGDAAEAIRTTDTVRKEVVVPGDGYLIGGMAKGAAMLAPNMATMLAVLTTDAAVDGAALRSALALAVEGTFNAITIDGCTSTNDTVIVLAGGGGAAPDSAAFTRALRDACASLAEQMVRDAEGATKFVRVRVKGAASDAEARRAARKVAESQLVKCSWYGEDPYWGRILSEIGTAGVHVDPDTVVVSYGDTVVAAACVAVDHDRHAVAAHMAGPEIEITADLGLGTGDATILSADLTHGYVDENMGTS